MQLYSKFSPQPANDRKTVGPQVEAFHIEIRRQYSHACLAYTSLQQHAARLYILPTDWAENPYNLSRKRLSLGFSNSSMQKAILSF